MSEFLLFKLSQVLPFTFILPQLSLPLFIYHSCCLNCLSGSIRLSKQRCYTVPACYKYLWCVSPFTPHPLFPFSVSLRSSLLFFLFLPFFLRYTGRHFQAHGGTQWQRIRKRSPVVEKTPWAHFYCHCVITCHSERSQKSMFVSPSLLTY